MARPRFDLRLDAGREMVAATEFTYNGVDYAAGDPFPVDDLDPRRVSTLHGARRINFKNDRQQEDRDARAARRAELLAPPATSPVTIEPQPGGYYLVSAPWLDEPERIRGKAPAEARVAELEEAGEPETHHGVTLTEGENGWWTLTREGLDGELKVRGEDEARQAAAQLRAGEQIEGQPVEWTPVELKVGDVVLVAEDDSSDLAGRRGTINEIRDDLAEVYSFNDKDELDKALVPLTSLSLAPLAEGDTALVGEDAGEPLAGKIVVVETIEGEDATVATYPDADDNVLTGTVPLASLTAAERPADEGEEGPADDETADGAGPDQTPAPALPEGGGDQSAETPPAGQSEGDGNDEA